VSNKSDYQSRSTAVLPVVLYGGETLSLSLREEDSLRVFENRVLRRLFGAKRDGVTGGWRKLRNEELRDLYSALSVIRIIESRRMRWAGHGARKWGRETAYVLLVGIPEGKKTLGKPRHTWVDNIKINLGFVE
jgi:hypothetical protein